MSQPSDRLRFPLLDSYVIVEPRVVPNVLDLIELGLRARRSNGFTTLDTATETFVDSLRVVTKRLRGGAPAEQDQAKEPTWIVVRSAASILGVSTQAVRDMMHSNRFGTPRREGRVFYLDEAAVRRVGADRAALARKANKAEQSPVSRRPAS